MAKRNPRRSRRTFAQNYNAKSYNQPSSQHSSTHIYASLSPSKRSEAILQAAEKVRARLQEKDADSDELALIHFDLGDNRFAVHITDIAKIDHVPEITPVPNTPSFVYGVANLRGTIFPILDLAAMLDIKDAGGETRGLLIFREGRRQFGVVSHSLPDYFKTSQEAIEEAPRSNQKIYTVLSSTVRYENRLIGIIDSQKLTALIERSLNVS